MKNSKIIFRVISLILSVMIILQILPITVMAEEFTERQNLMNTELSFSMNDISSVSAEITDVPVVNDETSVMMGLDNVSSAVEYTSVMSNTDLVYDIGADKVKESIILSNCPAENTEYSYTINSNCATL